MRQATARLNRTDIAVGALSISGTRATSADRYVGDMIVLDGGGAAASAYVLDRALDRQDDRADAGAERRDDSCDEKTFELAFCTVARWEDGQIVEENLFYNRSA